MELEGGRRREPSKTIGVLTSGGDCAGLNAVIRAIVARAVEGYGGRVSKLVLIDIGQLRPVRRRLF